MDEQAEKIKRLELALKVYDADNNIGNDYKAYKLYCTASERAMSRWARGELEVQPKRSEFGLEGYNMDDMIVEGEIK